MAPAPTTSLSAPSLNSTVSAVTRGCAPVAPWLKLCPNDFAAVVGILFFVCYVLWGVPLTIRLFKLMKRGVLAVLPRSRRAASRRDSTSSSTRNLTSDPGTHSIGSCSDDSLDGVPAIGLGLGLDSDNRFPAHAIRTAVPEPTMLEDDTLRLRTSCFPVPLCGDSPGTGTPSTPGGWFDVTPYPSSSSSSSSSSGSGSASPWANPLSSAKANLECPASEADFQAIHGQGHTKRLTLEKQDTPVTVPTPGDGVSASLIDVGTPPPVYSVGLLDNRGEERV